MKAASLSILAGMALAFGWVPAMAQANGVGSPFELAYWQAVADSGDAAQFEAYLAQYPQGTFAAIARLRIAALGGRPAAAPAAQVPMVAPASPPPPPASTVAKPAPAPMPAPAALPAAAPTTDLIARASALEARTGPDATSIALPPAPQLAPVPEVLIPPSFCSALDRNAFHDDVYRPARAVAQDNNRAAIAHLRALQELYDSYAPARDFERMNIIADAAHAYEPLADNTYDVTVAYDALFDRLMAVRIAACAAPQ